MKLEHESNRIAWNEAAAHYRQGLAENIDFLKAGKMTFTQPELHALEEFREPIGRCIHLQCAGGGDTLSWINYGAKEVVGLDISEEMLRVAQAKSNELKMNAHWIQSDVLNAPDALNGTADVVYTGKGAINWIMDIHAWAQVVTRLLRPNGRLFLFEGHPFTYAFDMKATTLQLDPAYQGYFAEAPYVSQDWPETYVGQVKASLEEQSKKYERPWPVSEVITALLAAGMVLEKLAEYPESYWDEFPNLPETIRRRIPNTFLVIARRPIVSG